MMRAHHTPAQVRAGSEHVVGIHVDREQDAGGELSACGLEPVEHATRDRVEPLRRDLRETIARRGGLGVLPQDLHLQDLDAAIRWVKDQPAAFESFAATPTGCAQ